jgi:hypothetical protein
MLRPNDIIGSDSLIWVPAMQISSMRKTRAPAGRPAYRSLEGWALGTLIEQHAVTECEYHGHRRDQADPDAWNRAREEAWRNPFPGAKPGACIAALEEVIRSIGDSCPDC